MVMLIAEDFGMNGGRGSSFLLLLDSQDSEIGIAIYK